MSLTTEQAYKLALANRGLKAGSITPLFTEKNVETSTKGGKEMKPLVLGFIIFLGVLILMDYK